MCIKHDKISQLCIVAVVDELSQGAGPDLGALRHSVEQALQHDEGVSVHDSSKSLSMAYSVLILWKLVPA
jgi:hypothetical protein